MRLSIKTCMGFCLMGIVPLCAHAQGYNPQNYPSVAQGLYHSAQTPAEATLDGILSRAMTEPTMAGYALDLPDRSKVHDKSYAKIMTRDFSASVAALQRRMVDDQCNGVYKDDEICGFEANPFTCSPNVGSQPYLFTTTKQNKREAFISAIPADQVGQVAGTKYRLILDRKAWKLDGVLCFDQVNFNYRIEKDADSDEEEE